MKLAGPEYPAAGVKVMVPSARATVPSVAVADAGDGQGVAVDVGVVGQHAAAAIASGVSERRRVAAVVDRHRGVVDRVTVIVTVAVPVPPLPSATV